MLIHKFGKFVFLVFFLQKIRRPSKFKKMFKEFAWHLLFIFINIVHIVKNLLLDLVLGWYLGQRQRCPALKENQYLKNSAIDLAQMIRNREITSTQLVKACTQRIKEVTSNFKAFLFVFVITIQQFFICNVGKWIVECSFGWTF